MHLEFARGFIDERLYAELDFAGYLSLFSGNLPLLPGKILRPMTEKEGREHYQHLAMLEGNMAGDEEAARLLTLSRALVNLDAVLPCFAAGRLEQYHLFELGRFLDGDERLRAEEANLPLEPQVHHELQAMQALLREKAGDDYGQVRAGAEGARLTEQLAAAESELQKATGAFEQSILDETGLKMIYPWPREVMLSPGEKARIGACRRVTISDKGDLQVVGYLPDPAVSQGMARRDALCHELAVLMASTLAAVNVELQHCHAMFADYYRKRRRRVYHYLLLAAKKEHGLTLPAFCEDSGASIRQAFMPALKGRRGGRCVPLDMDLVKGANVLFGAHLTGKTTVLKTLFFILSLVRAGLPVPAGSLLLSYPEKVAMLLRSSGDVHREESSFSEEITFLCGEITAGAWLLIDELFLSTDPQNGAILSEIFLKDLNRRDLVLLCTTHYPAVLDIDGLAFLRMLDCGTADDSRAGLAGLRETMPYRLEKIAADQDREIFRSTVGPLQRALLFPLPAEIKEAIRSAILSHKKLQPQRKG